MAQSGNRYINLLTDYGFKRAFGDEEVMTAFLTDLLQPKSPISKITLDFHPSFSRHGNE